MKYKIKNICQNVIALVVPDDYDRAMLFCRVQEFYESPNKNFKNKGFSIWDYYRWYSKEHSGCFSYVKDFVGFNLPLIVAKKCYQINETETPYDVEMKRIVDELFVSGERKYLIGVDCLKNSTFDHELCHALYYTNMDYKIEMDELTASISKVNLQKFKKNLKSIGYCSEVMKDEIQAYMATEVSKKVAKGIGNAKSLHKKYKAVFKKYRSS
jgi:hypothetical protein